MEEESVWEEIEGHLGIFMTFYGKHIDDAKLKEERQKQGKTLPFDDAPFVNSLIQRSFDSYQRIERGFLDNLIDSLNKFPTAPQLHEVRSDLVEIVRARYSHNFGVTITGDEIQQGVGDVNVKSGDYLLKGGLDKLLKRIELKDDQYHLKQ